MFLPGDKNGLRNLVDRGSGRRLLLKVLKVQAKRRASKCCQWTEETFGPGEQEGGDCPTLSHTRSRKW